MDGRFGFGFGFACDSVGFEWDGAVGWMNLLEAWEKGNAKDREEIKGQEGEGTFSLWRREEPSLP